MKKFFTLVALAFTAVSMSAQESAIYAWQDEFEANNTITFADGATIQITGNPDKTISKGNKITIDGTEYVSMKVSNVAENTFTAPEGKKVSKATFYSYVNKDAQTDRPAFWKEVAGVAYTVDECGELMCFKDGANPDVRSYTLPEAAASFTVTNAGEQLCYVLVVEFGDGAAPVSDDKVSIIDNFTYCWNANESVTHNEDGSITFNAVQWGGVASWLVVDDKKADWSEYSKIVFEYAEPTTVNTQILLGSYSAWGNPGITSLEMSFEDKDVSAVDQVALQCSDPTTLVITAIYLVKKGGDAVAITSLTNNALSNAKIYNLSGQVVDKNYKGIVISNGKKFLQK
ncbi:MAG: hypothetical protein J6S65_04560 [Bacteroidaceae bacterium]|nr:hypothetical protein [Bacteroidaceae bacterium]